MDHLGDARAVRASHASDGMRTQAPLDRLRPALAERLEPGQRGRLIHKPVCHQDSPFALGGGREPRE